MLRIRLRRMGNRNRPFYRVVVSDSRKTPTASAVEEVGHYDPAASPPRVRIDAERVDYWVGVGARPSPTVTKLLRAQQRGAPEESAEELASAASRETAEEAVEDAPPAEEAAASAEAPETGDAEAAEAAEPKGAATS